jgi:tRNA(Ile2)-agmatinylcytidine synthase
VEAGGALLVERLLALGAEFIDYPNLIRLNPNAPWKTRGNGAVSLRIQCPPEVVVKLMRRSSLVEIL